jgi:WD40 repeat protein
MFLMDPRLLLLAATLWQPAVGVDQYGDPLPKGALLRIGTTRLRPGEAAFAMRFGPDGKTLTTVGRGGTVHVWDVATGREMASQRLPIEPQHGCGISPDGRLIAAPDAQCYTNNTMRVFEVKTGKEVYRFNEAWNPNVRLEFAPDGQTLAVLKINGKLDVRNVADGKGIVLRTIDIAGRAPSYPALIFAPDGKSFLVSMPGHDIGHFDYQTGKRLMQFDYPMKDNGGYGALAISADAKVVAGMCQYAQHVDVYEAGGKWRCSFGGNLPSVFQVWLMPDGKHVLASLDQSRLGVFDATTGKQVRTLDGHNTSIFRTAFSPDGKTMATADNAVIRLWDTATFKPLHDYESHRGYNVMVRYSPNGKTLVSQSYGEGSTLGAGARVWDAATGKELKRIGWDADGPWSLGAVSGDGQVLAHARQGDKTRITEVATKKVLREIDDRYVCTQLALNADGTRLMLFLLNFQPGGIGSKVQLWDVTDGRMLAQLVGPGDVEGGAFDNAGRTLLVWRGRGDERELTCFDVATGRKFPRSTVKPIAAGHVALAPCGWYVATSTWKGGPVVLREAASSKMLGELAVRDHRIQELAFSGDGRLLAGATAEGAVLVWDALTGQEVACLEGHRGLVTSVAWSPDGKRLVSGGIDLTILVWDAQAWRSNLMRSTEVLPAKEMDQLWQRLADADALRAAPAVQQLVRASKATLALLKDRLKPAAPEELARLKELVAQLNHDKFAVRVAAQRELEKGGDAALALLHKVLDDKPALEVRLRVEKILQKIEVGPVTPETLRQLRALAALQMQNSPDSRAVLDALAHGDPHAWLTLEARAALKRGQ